MFNIIKANITPYEAEELYPNNTIVLLYPDKDGDDVKGDVIYVGDSDGAYSFTEPIEPPVGYTFFTLDGANLRIMTPINIFSKQSMNGGFYVTNKDLLRFTTKGKRADNGEWVSGAYFPCKGNGEITDYILV